MCRRLLPALLVALFAAATSLGAQEPSPAGAAPPAVRVFLDCPSGCDSTYIRKELNFVDHVRDREVADVHVLVTAEGAGGGGRALHHQLHGPPRVRRDQ